MPRNPEFDKVRLKDRLTALEFQVTQEKQTER
jgi:peptide methionine sulfoxide reductase MsrB